MLQNNCRIEARKGFRFYEKDMLFDDFIYTNNIEIELDVNYSSVGFGIAILESSGKTLKEKDNVYLFKIGYKEISMYYSTKESLTLIKQVNCLEAFTVQENLKFKMIKTGKKIDIYINEKLALSEYIKKSLDRYSIGYYSNKGNTVNMIKSISNTPDKWTVNMKNSIGGYINFIQDGFEILECENDAEIEQSNIALKKGIYYFKCETTGDIDYYIYPSDEKYTGVNSNNRFYDDKKNILNKKTGMFVLKDDTLVSLKFKGTNGTVKNIIISEDKNDEYVSTDVEGISFKGSYIDIYLNDLNKIVWKGTVKKVPKSLDPNELYGLIMDNRTQIRPHQAGVSNNIEYDFAFNTKDYAFEVRKDNKITHPDKKFILKNLANKVTIFRNMTSEITELKLHKKNGEIIDVNIQDEHIRYVNGDINSPIVVLDEFSTPLDLSSSYRLDINKNSSKYIFTNWEREFFIPNKKIKLEKKVLNKQDTIILNCIKKGYEYDIKKIYEINNGNINSIDLMTNNYETKYEIDIEYIDKELGILYLNDSFIDDYDLIIVDYLKDDSYAINYEYIKNMYKIDISTTKNNNKLLYDGKTSIVGNKEILETTNYIITEIDRNTNGYIVLRGGL